MTNPPPGPQPEPPHGSHYGPQHGPQTGPQPGIQPGPGMQPGAPYGSQYGAPQPPHGGAPGPSVPPGQPGPPPGWQPTQEGGPAAAYPGGTTPQGGGTNVGAEAKGFLSALFDLSFKHSITVRLIRVVYLLTMLLTGGVSLVLLAYGIWLMTYPNGALLGLIMILAVPLIWVFQVAVVRIFLEFVVNQFRITEELQEIRRKDAIR